MIEITGRTKVVGLIGAPVWNSPFPRLANAAFEALSLPHVMVPFNVDESRLKDALASARGLGLAGFCVARPNKERIGPLLPELGPTSQMTASVDTVSFSGDRPIGHNTEFWSFLSALKEETGAALKGKRALLLGAGGTAKSIAAALLKEGVQSLTICNRTRPRSEQLAAYLAGKFPAVPPRTIPLEPAEFRRALKDCDFFINATPSGLESPKGPLALERDLDPALIVFDANFTPATPLLLLSRRVGCQSVAGTRMLLWQVLFSVRQWTGEEPPRAAIEGAIDSLLGASLAS